MDSKTLARAAEASYNTKSAPPGYARETLSTPDIGVYKKDNTYIVAHRGTDIFSPTAGKQVAADLKIAVGAQSADPIFKSRAKTTEAIIKKIPVDAEIYLTAHSLGGETAQYAMIASPITRDRVTRFESFNSASSPVGLAGNPVTPAIRAVIASKSVHNRVKGDEISINISKNMIGKIKTFENKQKPSISKSLLDLARPILQNSALGRIGAFAGDKLVNTLSSHSLTNFTK